jgi:glycosyltransferase involved in cell wall biosynthesis
MRKPLVSIVVPVYDGAAFLADALTSALEQDHGHVEVVVADNVSTDGSAEIADAYARRDARVRVVRADDHLGIRPNWNRAARLIDPDAAYVKFLSADDLLLPGGISRQVAVAEAHPRVAVVGGYRRDGDALGCTGLALTTTVARGRDIARRMLLGGSDLFGAPPNVLYRADLVRARPELYELPFFNFDDGACMELLGSGDFGFVHEVVSWSRVHPGQQTTAVDRLRQWEFGDLALLTRYGPAYLAPDELRRRLHAALRRYGTMLATQAVTGRLWRDREFRAHHAEALARISGELSASGMHGAARATGALGRGLARTGGGQPLETRWAFA